MLIEAKYKSGASEGTKYDVERDQLIRLLDVGSWYASPENPQNDSGGHVPSYVIVLQYGDASINAEEVVSRYAGRPEAIQRALPYRTDLTTEDFRRLSRSVAFVRWPDPLDWRKVLEYAVA